MAHQGLHRIALIQQKKKKKEAKKLYRSDINPTKTQFLYILQPLKAINQIFNVPEKGL